MLSKPKDGAWQEIESVNKPVDGAWQECEAVFKPLDGAWQEVWSAVKEMVLKSNEITKNTQGYALADNLGYALWKYMDKATGEGSLSGTGRIIFYLEGEWTNPTISLIGEGGLIRSNADYTKWYRSSAGNIDIYARRTGGSEIYTTAIEELGNLTSTDEESTEVVEYSDTLSGTFDRLGISMDIAGTTSEFYSATIDLIVRDVFFDGKKIGFPDYTFDNM